MLSGNPFDVIDEKLDKISLQLDEVLKLPHIPKIEIIDRKELCIRLAITQPTAIRWEKKGQIPCLRIGDAVRYNWTKVIEKLENNNKKHTV